MNRTQKEAWFNLVGALLCLSVSVYLVIEIGVLKRLPERWFAFCLVVAFCFLMAASIIFLRRKQSPREVDSDERDRQIQRRAVLVSFVSVWALLFAASAVPMLLLGTKGTIEVWLLPLINVTVGMLAILIYTAAVLIQYGKGGGNGGG